VTARKFARRAALVNIGASPGPFTKHPAEALEAHSPMFHVSAGLSVQDRYPWPFRFHSLGKAAAMLQ
jgi:hypothetical protein